MTFQRWYFAGFQNNENQMIGRVVGQQYFITYSRGRDLIQLDSASRLHFVLINVAVSTL